MKLAKGFFAPTFAGVLITTFSVIAAVYCIMMDCLQSGCELFKEKTGVGVDLNIRNLATLSDGTVYPNHKLIEKSQEQIAKI